MTNSPNLGVRLPSALFERLNAHVDKVAAAAGAPARVMRATVVARLLEAALDAADRAESKKTKPKK